eukprot:m.111601 g.111601  ORF g.111601 m.111601 type:complete len:348 (+) comp9239_c0_seq1:92-1135(+)
MTSNSTSKVVLPPITRASSATTASRKGSGLENVQWSAIESEANNYFDKLESYLQDARVSFHASLKQSIFQLLSMHANKEKALVDELSNLKESETSQTAKITTLEGAQAELKHDMTSKNELIEQLNLKLDELLVKMKESQDEREHALNVLKEETKMQKKEIVELNAIVQRTKEALTEKHVEVQSLEGKIKQKQSQKMEQTNEIKSLKAQVANMQDELMGLKRTTTERGKALDSAKKAKAEVVSLKKENEELSKKLSCTKDDVSAIIRERDDLSTKLSQAQSTLHGQLKEQEEEIAQLYQQIEKLKGAIANAAASKEYDAIEERMRRLIKANKSEKKKLSEARKKSASK